MINMINTKSADFSTSEAFSSHFVLPFLLYPDKIVYTLTCFTFPGLTTSITEHRITKTHMSSVKFVIVVII